MRVRPNRHAFVREGHVVVTTSGTGHAIVDKELARNKVKRDIVLRVASFLGVARIVAQTEQLAVVPRRLGETLATHEAINVFEPPLPSYDAKLHWHERFHADPGNVWIRKVLAQLFAA